MREFKTHGFGPAALTPLGPEPLPVPRRTFGIGTDISFVPDIIQRVFPPAAIKILVVTDTLSFALGGFALGRFCAALEDHGGPEHPAYARFDVTKAATVSGASADIQGFTFSDASLAGYDQLWLFGFGGGPTGPDGWRVSSLEAGEVAAIERFMDAGKGVFATGDHEDLGLGLAAGIKRVRSMRRWYDTHGGAFPLPPGEIETPDQNDLTRIDTREPVLPGAPNSGSETDAEPQVIRPRYYNGPSIFRQYPHPVLCGPRGAIRVFPDHAHEGFCQVPSSPDAAEFPGPAPQVIAWGDTVAGRTKGAYTLPNSTPFGLLAAYDGHEAEVGRVVTDSTWHHWMDMNIDPMIAAHAADPAETAWLDVLAYFRNVAVWLSPKNKQRAMRRAGTTIFAFAYPFIEEIQPSLAELHLARPVPLATAARDALGRVAPRCQHLVWFRDLLRETEMNRLADILDPWGPKRPGFKMPDDQVAILAETTLYAALGGAAVAVREAAERGEDQKALDEKGLDAAMAKHAGTAVRKALEELAERSERTCEGIKSLL